MNDLGIKKIVFSSSCTVYGDPKYLPVDEKHETGKFTNPYGLTKYVTEEMFKGCSVVDQVILNSLRFDDETFLCFVLFPTRIWAAFSCVTSTPWAHIPRETLGRIPSAFPVI